MAKAEQNQKIVGYQRWRHLLFAHWRREADEVQNLLPDGLTVETFDGAAWLAIVPFSMERVRPWWAPPVPGISWFLETNVRTYVRHRDGQTGVWFFSLDADCRLAVAVARRFWHLNYRDANMTMNVSDGQLAYAGDLRKHSARGYRMNAEIDNSQPLVSADPGSLEHFLLERYHLIAQRPDGRYLCGQVHHAPYRFQPVRNCTVQQTLIDGLERPLPGSIPPDHVVYSPGVNVGVSSLQLITAHSQ